MIPPQIIFKKWVPHTNQPNNLKAGLSRTFWTLQQRGDLLVTTLLARDLRRDILPESLLEKIWDWDRREVRSDHRTMSLADRVEDAASMLSAVYAVGELDRDDLNMDLQLEDVQDLDKLASSVMYELMVRCSECAISIMPNESLASLLIAASDSGLGGWSHTKVLDTWKKLKFPILAILPSAIRWASSEIDNIPRSEARKFGMMVYFDFLETMALDPGDERTEFPLWANKVSQIANELFYNSNSLPNACDKPKK